MNATRVVANAGDAAFAVDAEGIVIAWNNAAEHRLGYRPEEILGRHCWQILQCREESADSPIGKDCPLREMVFQGQPVNRGQLLFGLVDHAPMILRTSSGRPDRADTATFMVQGESGTRELVHVL